MKRFALALTIVLSSLCLAMSQAYADDVKIESEVTLDGFNNTGISTGFTTTDAFDSWHSCTTGNNSSCTASNSYGSPPKNMHEYICIPSNLSYNFTSSCQTLLTQDDDGDCHANDTQELSCGGQRLGPDCQWRTGSSGTAKWSWTITASSGGPYTIDCSNSGYSGTH